MQFYSTKGYFFSQSCDRKISNTGWRGAQTPPPTLNAAQWVKHWPHLPGSLPVSRPWTREGREMPRRPRRHRVLRCPLCHNRTRFILFVATIQQFHYFQNKNGGWKRLRFHSLRGKTPAPFLFTCGSCAKSLGGSPVPVYANAVRVRGTTKKKEGIARE